MTATLSCSACDATLPFEAAGSISCPNCGKMLRLVVFPALFAGPKAGSFGDRIVDGGESSCFYHGEKKASAICEGCGRFLCGLCDIEFGGEHLCSNCLETGRGESGRKNETNRVLYEQIALTLALVGLLLGPLGVLTSIAAIFLSIRHWNKPGRFGSRGKVRKIVAITLASVVLVFWIGLAGWALF